MAALSALAGATLVMAGQSVRGARAGADPAPGGRDGAASTEISSDARTFLRHVAVLASQTLEGRALGTRGHELALDYVEQHFRAAGLLAPGAGSPQTDAFGSATSGSGAMGDQAETASPRTYRQRFELGTKDTVLGGHLATLDGGATFTHGLDADFVVTALGSPGAVQGPLVCVGYAIDRGPEGAREFTSFPSGLRLDGKVALALRFEPMDEEGRSRWDPERMWSPRAQLDQKFSALQRLGASAVILVNPPGAFDPRAETLLDLRTRARGAFAFPVLHLSREAGERLVAALDPGGTSLLGLRQLADVGPLAVELGRGVTLRADIVREHVQAENVVGLLPGRGPLAAEWLVVGAELDPTVRGGAGGRAKGESALLPGADDNASGVAALLMLAERLAADARNAAATDVDGAPRRSIAFVAFCAGESGQRGARHFLSSPPLPAEDLTLMVSLERLGRLQTSPLAVEGAGSGRGLGALVEDCLGRSDAEVVQPERPTGRGGHTPFWLARVPVLWLHGARHKDHYTPHDTADRVEPSGAVAALELARELVVAAAERPERIPFAGEGR